MFLHIFVADLALNSNKLLSKQCVGLKLSVINELDLTEYNIFTGQEKENLLFKFQQTIQIPVSDKLLVRSKYNERQEYEKLLSKSHLTDHTMLFRLKFTLYAIYRHNTSSSEQSVCLGYGTLTTKLNDETISKTIVLQESQQLIDNQKQQGFESFHVLGKLYVTLFYHSSAIEISDNQSFLYDGKHPQGLESGDDSRQANKKKSVNEYSFLLSRKLRNNENDKMVTFDHLLESRLSKDAQWYQDTNVVKSKKSKVSNQSTNPASSSSSPSRRSSSNSIFMSPKSLQQNKKSASNSATGTPSEPPKLRKTHMSVGYVKNEWPEPHNKTTDMEKRIYQLQLMNEKKLKLIAQIAKEIEQKYSKREKESASSSGHFSNSIRSQQQRKEELEREQQERLLRKQLKHQTNEVKNLELQLTKLRLESALALSSQPPVESKHSQCHSFSSKKAPFDNYAGGKVDLSSSLLHRLVNDISREQQRTSGSGSTNAVHVALTKSKKKKNSTIDSSKIRTENDILQRLISTDAVKQKLNKELQSTAMNHTTSSAIRATSPAKPILVSPSAQKRDYPKFVKSSILESLASKEKKNEIKGKSKTMTTVKTKQSQLSTSQSTFSAATTTALKKKHAKQKKEMIKRSDGSAEQAESYESYYRDDGVDDYWLSYHQRNFPDRNRNDIQSGSNDIIRVSVQQSKRKRESMGLSTSRRDHHDERRQKDIEIRGYLDNSDEDMDDSVDWVTRGYGEQQFMRDRYNEGKEETEEGEGIESPYKELNSSDFDRQHESYSYFPQDEEFSHDNVMFNNFMATQKLPSKATTSNLTASLATPGAAAEVESKRRSLATTQNPVFESYSEEEEGEGVHMHNSDSEHEVDSEAQSIPSEDIDHNSPPYVSNLSGQIESDGSMSEEETEEDSLKDLADGYKVPGFLQTLVLGDSQEHGPQTNARSWLSSHDHTSFGLSVPGRHSPVDRVQVASPLIHPHQDCEFSDDEEEFMRNHLTKKNTLANVVIQNQPGTLTKEIAHKHSKEKSAMLTVDTVSSSGSFGDQEKPFNPKSKHNRAEDDTAEEDDDEDGRQLYRDLMDGISDDDTVENVLETASAIKSIGVVGKRNSEDSLTPTARSSQGQNTTFLRDDIRKESEKDTLTLKNDPSNRQNTVKFSASSIVHRSANDRIRSQFERNRQATAVLSSSSSNIQNNSSSADEDKKVEMDMTLSTEERVNFVIQNGKKEHLKFAEEIDPRQEDSYTSSNWRVKAQSGPTDRNKVLKQLEKNRQFQTKAVMGTSGNTTTKRLSEDSGPFDNIQDESVVSPSLILSSPTVSKKEWNGRSPQIQKQPEHVLSPGFSSIRAEMGDIANSLGKLEEQLNSGNFSQVKVDSDSVSGIPSQSHSDDNRESKQQDIQDLVDNVLQASYQSSAKVSKSSSPHRSIDEDREAFRKFLEEVESDEDSAFSYSRELKERNLSKQLGILDTSESDSDHQSDVEKELLNRKVSTRIK